MASPKYPMTVVFKGGRVVHIARRIRDDNLAVVTLCGKRGVPNPGSTARDWCKACLAKPNPQDQRSYGGTS
jgi:hypothetical protein